MFALAAAVLFVIGAIAVATDAQTAFGQPYPFWLMLGLAAYALHAVYPVAVPVARRASRPGAPQ